MQRSRLLFLVLAATSAAAFASADKPKKRPARQSPRFEAADLKFFQSRVLPLLKARCFQCHGPDVKKPKGGLRLNSRAALLKGGESGPAAVPGDPRKSRLIDAVNYRSFEMPPRGKLPAGEIAVLTKWVKRGLPFSTGAKPAVVREETFPLQERKRSHWAWRPIRLLPLPAVRNAKWAATPIDRFILAKLEAKGLSPNPPADRRTLIRRAYFDLIGLPPSPRDVAEFVADPAPTREAFAKRVDRLLASKHFGERWGRHWLDLVRYADTLGHEFDYPLRYAHQYRDYVIRAFNADVPYDQFVREHIAGDLLENPRRHPSLGYNESIIGTGFWFLGEAKHAPVDVKAEEASTIDNQIDVFSKAFLGLTVGCARCHDHKFDAISTRDYYALHGFLQSSHRNTALLDPHGRIHKAVAEIRKLKRAGEKLLRRTALRGRGVDVAPKRRPGKAVVQKGDNNTKLFVDFNGNTFDGWMPTGFAFGDSPTQPGEWDVNRDKPQFLEPGVAHSRRFADRLGGVLRSPTFTITHDQILYRVKGENARIRLIIDGYVMDEFSALLFKGCLQKVNTGGRWTWLRQAGDVHRYKGHRAHIELIDDGDGWLAVDEIRFANNGDPIPKGPSRRKTAFQNRPSGLFGVGRKESRAAATASSLGRQPQGSGRRQTVQPRRGDIPARAVRHDAAPPGLRRDFDHFNPGLTPRATRFRPSGTGGSGSSKRIRSTAAESRLTPTISSASLIAGRSKVETSLGDILKRIRKTQASLPDPMRVIAITDGSSEDEHVFIRGSHKNLGPVVPRRMLEAISGPDQKRITKGSGRLQLAQRLLDPSDPFPARVMVNRLWHHLTGRGIVASVDNFGVLGQRPTHPELLDWLAARFREDGWSLKKSIRRIMLSNTYMMSSAPDPAADRANPRNLLLHRMRIRRLEGEAIRDAMLAVSRRLDAKMFGEPVPVHLTPFMQGRGRPKRSGPLDGNGRRSIYLIVRRNFLSPLLLAFDTPIPFTTIGRRNVSNVPAQALILMNDPFVVQQARLWARRALEERAASPEDRIRRMYLAAFAREPGSAELRNGLYFLQTQGASLGLKGDAWKTDRQVWSDFAHVLFNVKEFTYLR